MSLLNIESYMGNEENVVKVYPAGVSEIPQVTSGSCISNDSWEIFTHAIREVDQNLYHEIINMGENSFDLYDSVENIENPWIHYSCVVFVTAFAKDGSVVIKVGTLTT